MLTNFGLDINLNFTYVSPSVTRLFGYTVEEGMAPLDKLLTPFSLEVIKKVHEEEYANKEK